MPQLPNHETMAMVIRLDSRQCIEIRPNRKEGTVKVSLLDAAGRVIAEADEDAKAFLKGSNLIVAVANK